ncbi:MAG: carotenoid biosynthesis protein [Bacteroidales bacterium]|nr:carotenoid biosynthesis protein [Bacteroidales bacterium]
MLKNFIQLIDKRLIFVLIILYTVGVVIHSLNYTFQLALLITEGFLYLVNVSVLLLILLRTDKKGRYLLFIALFGLVTIFLEIIGVKTGLVFGEYYYEDMWKVTMMGVPVIIGVNWMVLMIASSNIAKHLFKGGNLFLICLFSGLFIFCIDLVLEQVAIQLKYWYWIGDAIPKQNYLIWFLLGALFPLLERWIGLNIKWKKLIGYYIINWVFFAAIMLFGQSA